MRKEKKLSPEVLGLVNLVAVRTQYEVAEMLGCSRANVQQLEHSALYKLHRALVRLDGG